MDAARRFIWGPTPEEQRRKCRSLIRSNERKLEKDQQNLKALNAKTRNYILQASKRGQRNPSQAEQAARETRTFARELIRVRKQEQRVATQKATLTSVGMQIDEAFGMRKIETSLKNSTKIMHDVNMLIKLPALSASMRELSQELMKAGIIEEMVSDSMPETELEGEDEAADAEVDKVLGEVLKDRIQTPAVQVPDSQLAEPEVPAEAEAEMDPEEMLAQMRGRLEELKS